MAEHNHAHLQAMAAIFGQLPGEAQILAVAFSEDLHLFAALSGTEDF